MKNLAIITLAVLGSTLAFEPKHIRYHDNVGIPLAQEIKAFEEGSGASTRIVGGSYTQLGAFPFFAGLLTTLQSGYTSVCGSTLLSNTKVLTAAHCWFDSSQTGISVEVIFASTKLFSGGVRVSSTQVEAHSSYRPQTLDHDIAIITIPHVEYTDLIKPVTLPSGFLLYLTFAGNIGEAVGFGVYADNQNIAADQSLKNTSMVVIPNLECAAIYGFSITDYMLCTGTLQFTSTCSGDSGGPLTTTLSGDKVLIGITSFTAQIGCSQGYPAGFTRVTSYVPWINARL